MKFCPDCGTPHECTVTEGVSDAVRIAEIEANRDIKVAQLARAEEREFHEAMTESAEIRADAEVAIAETEAEAGTEAAEAVAGALTEVLAPEPPPAPAPVVIEDQADEEALPPRDEREHGSERHAPEPKRGFF